ncbi:MAG TPA: hypothetical protein VNN17_11970 [Terriglobia bacterium]|nr:hypothetical protein [Terriglobia bacterium]
MGSKHKQRHSRIGSSVAHRSGAAGVTLLEILIVLSILMIVGGYAVYNLLPTIRLNRVDNAVQVTLQEMRRARQLAIDERRVHVLVVQAPRTVRIDRIDAGVRTVISQVPLTNDVAFQVEPGIPTNPTQTPDGFGAGALAIDINGSNEIYFQADGSARDALGRVANGVVYLCLPGELISSRAISLFGATGRLKSWKLRARTDGTYEWQ